ncbi:retron St85 family RNA-directed DNA polymerase [Aliivibrio salmonicida]|uniref:retron St85 family RNA-directed DNA polymerase n=1 Tax=Aliivibrio salmonicida TaxID=40269 RepID=UPI00406CFCBF
MKKLLDYLTSSGNLKNYLKLTYPQISYDDDIFLIMGKYHLSSLYKSAPKMYKFYTIPKRNGGRRAIAHPSKKLKVTQRDLSTYLEKILPVHDCAFAYRKNRSIKDNALIHVGNKFLLKMDLVNFFNSITPEMLKNEIKENELSFEESELDYIKKLAFWCPSKEDNGKLILSVGAPSSPLLSNFIMYRFDSVLNEIAKANKVKYSRYADDIFLSTNVPNVLKLFVNIVKVILKEMYHDKFIINEMKTVFSSKAHNRHVTGITITNDNKISLGRQNKRMISSLVHKYSLGVLETSKITRLRGLISFASSIEPDFIIRLENKYTFNLINILIKGLD